MAKRTVILPEQAEEICQTADTDRKTVIRIEPASLEVSLTVYHIRRHNIDFDGGNVIFVEDEAVPGNESYPFVFS